MEKEDLLDFLNAKQQKSLEGYIYFNNENVSKLPFKNGDYIKFMYRYNYKFMEGGVITSVLEYPILKVRCYDMTYGVYRIDVGKIYLFYKKNRKAQTRREYFEELLENLERVKLKKSI